MIDDMEDNELASLFAAKKEIEELKAKIKELESSAKVSKINIDSLVETGLIHESSRRVLDDAILDRDEKINKLQSFIIHLDKYPMFWARSYKIHIDRFINEQGIEY
jgi:hypothetical protein